MVLEEGRKVTGCRSRGSSAGGWKLNFEKRSSAIGDQLCSADIGLQLDGCELIAES